jgi:hypothetical protein
MATVLVIVHGLVAVALLGAITHQTLSAWAVSRPRPGSFFGRFRTVPPAAFANAIIVLYLVTATLGAIVYLYFLVEIKPALAQANRWELLGFLDLKEHFIAIGLALLPAYFVCWRHPGETATRARAALTSLLAFIVWWSFLVGHVMNNVKGFGE